MMDTKGKDLRLGRKRRLFALWAGVLLVTAAAAILPVSSRATRTILVFSPLTVWCAGAALLALARHGRWALAVFCLPPLGLGLFLAFPGDDSAPPDLRGFYLREMAGYEGTRYVWGGENGLGIDCSGLVRKGLVNAHLALARRDRDAGQLRAALELWWHDATAKGLGEGYGGRTRLVTRAAGINAVETALLAPGDLAVTEDGMHVLAHLGAGEWIQADPYAKRVIRERAPSRNPWYAVPVRVMRWGVLEGGVR